VLRELSRNFFQLISQFLNQHFAARNFIFSCFEKPFPLVADLVAPEVDLRECRVLLQSLSDGAGPLAADLVLPEVDLMRWMSTSIFFASSLPISLSWKDVCDRLLALASKLPIRG